MSEIDFTALEQLYEDCISLSSNCNHENAEVSEVEGCAQIHCPECGMLFITSWDAFNKLQ